MTEHTAGSEWRRLVAATSLSEAFAGHIDGIVALSVEEVPWLANLAVPTGWQMTVAPDHQLRVCVYGERPDGGWKACETISVFEITGMVPARVVSDNAERMLRDLGAVGIFTDTVPTPRLPHLVGVRTEGHVTIAGRRLWVGLSTYVAGSDAPRQGRLVQHSVFVDADCLFQLGADIGALTEAARTAFWATNDVAAIGEPTAHLMGSASPVAESRELLAHSPNGDTSDSEPTSSRTTALTNQERRFISKALGEWRGAATGKPLPIDALGIASSWPEFDSTIERLRYAVEHNEELSVRDWSLLLYLTEQGWASTLVGAGLDFTTVSGIEDDDAVKLLRSIQWKLVVSDRASGQLLFPNAGRTVEPFDYDAWKRKNRPNEAGR